MSRFYALRKTSKLMLPLPHFSRFCLLTLACLQPAMVLATADENPAPLISHYPNAVSLVTRTIDYIPVTILSTPDGTADGSAPVFATIKGDVRQDSYYIDGVSGDKVMMNYREALKKAGYKVDFECTGKACGNFSKLKEMVTHTFAYLSNERQPMEPLYVAASTGKSEAGPAANYLVYIQNENDNRISVKTAFIDRTPPRTDLLAINPDFSVFPPGVHEPEEPSVIQEDDHPLLARYPGAQDFNFLTTEYEEVAFLTADTTDYIKPVTSPLRGDTYRAWYWVRNASSLKVLENYKQALTTAGFTGLAECTPQTCRNTKNSLTTAELISDGISLNGEKPYFYTARKDNLYATIFTDQRGTKTVVRKLIIDTDTAENHLITTDIDAFARLQNEAEKASRVQPSEIQQGDHPLIARYPGALDFRHISTDYEEVAFPTVGTINFMKPVTKPIKGDVYRASYWVKKASSLKVIENYKSALTAAGFTVDVECTPTSCANTHSTTGLENLISEETYFYATIPYLYTASKDGIYVAIFTNQEQDRSYAKIMIVETVDLEDNLMTVNAGEIERQIAESGKALIYGVYFDTGKASIRPDSKAALDAIGEFLVANPAQNFYVVGHTDDTGDLRANISLSSDRAIAVTSAMVSDYGIDKSRLQPEGVGPYAPEDTNRTSIGKSKNRRVELVLRLE